MLSLAHAEINQKREILRVAGTVVGPTREASQLVSTAARTRTSMCLKIETNIMIG
jgi:hypothetical protein